MGGDLLVSMCVGEGPLRASVNAAHGESVWLIAVCDEVVVRPSPVLRRQVSVGRAPVHRQFHRPPVCPRIPYEPFEEVLAQAALDQSLVAQA